MKKQEVLLLLTPKEAAKYLMLPLHNVYNLVKDGLLEGFKVGSDWRIKRDSVEKFNAPIGRN